VYTRCHGEDHTPTDYPIYCPKAFALIGKLRGALPDRCFPINMKRCTKGEPIRRVRRRVVQKEGQALRKEIEAFVTKKRGQQVLQVYDALDLLPISNDRMAELLLPLQAVLAVLVADRGGNPEDNYPLSVLKKYADRLDRDERDTASQSTGIRLLSALRQVFHPGDGQAAGQAVNGNHPAGAHGAYP
jgi:hypothetical protein